MDAELPVLPLTGETSPEACNQLINKLLGLPVKTGYFADIGILSGSLDETANSDRFFLDKGAFAMIGMDKYVIEATEQMQLVWGRQRYLIWKLLLWETKILLC